jgi:hypothetical protein
MVRPLVASLLALLLAACASGGDQPAGSTDSRTAPITRNNLDNQCLRELGQTGAMFTPLPDRYIAQGCTNLNTVQLSSWPSDRASLVATNLGPVTCEVSQAFVAWARFGVDRAAQQILGSPLRSVETMGSYSCRNVAGSSRRSGHATGAAIDVGAFVLEDGRRISVKGDWNGGSAQEREFLRTVRESACKRFGTVLSPDYNAAHHDHLHLEGVTSGRSYCR